MDVSLIIPVWNEEVPDLKTRLSDLDSFFSKFNQDFELVLILDPSQDQTQFVIENFQFKKLKMLTLKNNKHLGRSASILRGLKECRGKIAVTLSMDLSVPLADIFLLIAEVSQAQKPILAIGNTSTEKKKRKGERSSAQMSLESMVREKSKMRWPEIADPVCPSVSFSEEALLFFKKEDLQVKTWFLTPHLISWAKVKQISILNVPIQQRLKPTQRIPLIKEWLRNLL